MDARITKVIADALGIDVSKVETASTLDDLKADPLDRLTIAIGLDEEYNLYVPENHIHTWDAIADIHKSVDQLRGE
jgi:acyl carrier protein